MAKLLAALQRIQTKGGSTGRRGVPSAVKKEVPGALAKERQTAGLCIKCGAAWYSPGGRGHNSVTCKAAADKSTPASEGVKRAGPKPNF
jgi:hypothetical protein